MPEVPEAKFGPGDRVRVRSYAHPGHVRTPHYVRGKVGRNAESARVMDDAIRTLILGAEQIHLASGGIKLLAEVARATSHAGEEAGV